MTPGPEPKAAASSGAVARQATFHCRRARLPPGRRVREPRRAGLGAGAEDLPGVGHRPFHQRQEQGGELTAAGGEAGGGGGRGGPGDRPVVFKGRRGRGGIFWWAGGGGGRSPQRRVPPGRATRTSTPHLLVTWSRSIRLGSQREARVRKILPQRPADLVFMQVLFKVGTLQWEALVVPDELARVTRFSKRSLECQS